MINAQRLELYKFEVLKCQFSKRKSQVLAEDIQTGPK